MAVIGACMVPHPPIILPQIGRGEEKKIEETAAAYREAAQLIKRLAPDTLVIASPHTRMYADWFSIGGGRGSSGSFARFRAGQVKIRAAYDQDFVKGLTALAAERGFPAGPADLPDPDLDHGIMIPLYFIQEAYRDFQVVRVGLSGLSLTDHYRLGMMIREISDLLGRRIFFVASGDLSHKLKEEGPYGFAPEGPRYDEKIMDVMGRAAFGDLFAFDPTFCDKAAECGHRSFVMMAGALDRTGVRARSLSHQGTFGVGYGVCLYETAGEDPERNFLDRWTWEEEERLAARKEGEDPFVRLARLSVETYVRTGRPLRLRDAEKILDLPEDLLKRKAGAFVSLHKEGQLRGCIGTIAPCQGSLALEIIENGVSACSRDHRFHKVEESELPLLEYSVDVLSEPEYIDSADDLDVKRYGVIVSCGRKRGLLLPDLEGVDTPEDQIEIAARKGGISFEYDRNIRLQRFEVVRHF